MLHHVEIYVDDLVKSRQFYDLLLPKLGYVLYQEWREGFSYKDDQHYLVFVQVEDKFASFSYHRKQVGLNHMAFSGGAPQDIERLRMTLADKGVTFLYEDAYPYAGGENYFALFLEDPNQIKIEIVANQE
ncbi:MULTISPECIES: VOC family protein [Streptococcus]|uniref:VOC family protein n=1 Tax=Streptococcus caledonicus TaxID=2614158 RepID=A0ABW0UC21_9STRE|nr:VOC family protein [Streptococcus sp. S784/96/1]